MSTTTKRRSGRQSQPQRRSSASIVLGILALVVALAVALFVLRQGSGGAIPGEQRFPDQGGGLHLQNASDPLPLAYNSNPPTSGWHWGGGWAPWGIHDQPLPDTVMVHNLEHGGVIIHYRQGLDQATVDQLAQLTRTLEQQNSCIMLVPRPADQLDTPIAATSWTYLLKLDSFNTDALTNFFRQHVGYGFEPVCKPL